METSGLRESVPSQESREQADAREIIAAAQRTFSDDDLKLFNAIGEPGIQDSERRTRIDTFNRARAGKADQAESREERVYEKVPVRLGGSLIHVSRDANGVITVDVTI